MLKTLCYISGVVFIRVVLFDIIQEVVSRHATLQSFLLIEFYNDIYLWLGNSDILRTVLNTLIDHRPSLQKAEPSISHAKQQSLDISWPDHTHPKLLRERMAHSGERGPKERKTDQHMSYQSQSEPIHCPKSLQKDVVDVGDDSYSLLAIRYSLPSSILSSTSTTRIDCSMYRFFAVGISSGHFWNHTA